MCRGLAIIMSKSGKIYCNGQSSHTDLCKAYNLEEDDCLKFEVVINDKYIARYHITVDDNYEKNSTQGKEAKALLPEIKKWCKKNEVQVLRFLLSCQTYVVCKDNQYLNRCKAGNDQDMRECKAGNDQDMRYCKAGNDQYMCFCEAGNDQDMSFCKAGNDQDLSFCETGRDQDMSRCISGRYTYVEFMKCGDKKVNEFIKKLSNKYNQNNEKLRWRDVVRLAMKGYKGEKG